MPLTVEIITPEQSWKPGAYDAVTLPAFDGEVGILVDHAPFICQLGGGTVRLHVETGAEQLLVISGGVAKVEDNHLRILAENAAKMS